MSRYELETPVIYMMEDDPYGLEPDADSEEFDGFEIEDEFGEPDEGETLEETLEDVSDYDDEDMLDDTDSEEYYLAEDDDDLHDEGYDLDEDEYDDDESYDLYGDDEDDD